ncbi:diguanylate cyclase (GGDEF) domain-containing protein [Shewanella psychrophila]|uniref:diguanylate cyclase n=1 Tax=Shewanella psychrophila TaxID=225848 RepID=A0A1S6HVP9_9GAMM|nr:diguanylate cyclase (GGDEF) domain-containing protein [Shewanella psychrophila]
MSFLIKKPSILIITLICLSFFSFNLKAVQDISFDKQLKNADRIRSSNPNKFNEIVTSLLQQKSSLTHDQILHLSYLNAYRLTYKGQFDDGILLFLKIADSDASSLLKIRANISLVNIYAISKKWTKGLSSLSKTIELIPSIESQEIRQLAIASAVLFYNQLGQYELGLSFANKLLHEPIEGRTLCVAHNLKLESQFELGLLKEGDPQILEGIEACQQSNEVVMESAIYSYLAELHLKNTNPQKAILALEENLQAIEQSRYAPIVALYYSLLAKSYFQIESDAIAEDYAQKTIQQTKNIANSKPEVSSYKVLYQIAESRGEHQQALEYHKKYAEADRAYLDDIKTKHLAFQLAEHQTTEQKSRIELLDKQNNLLTIEQKLSAIKAENNRLFIAMLIAIITLLVFWAYKSWMTQKRLKQLAEYDALTGILNRGHFTQVAQSALKYCANTDMYLSCILFDLDKFKNINDSYGHACGDWVLKKVAKVCQAQGRKNDIFARLGGEEFCIVLPSCDLVTATKLAEEYRKVIERIDSADSGFDFTVSASFGVTDTLRSGHALEKLIADADEAMYESKHNGRNRITVYSVPTEDADSDKNTAANSGGAQADQPLFTGS